VPLTINFIDTYNYGIWLTLTSIITWVSFFDLGLGNGLRNCFAMAKAKGDNDLLKRYVSTTYVLISLFVVILIITFLIANQFIKWSYVLNTTLIGNDVLKAIVAITAISFLLRFIFNLISSILTGDQRPAYANAISVISNIFILIFLIVLVKYTKGSLFNLSLVVNLSNLLIPLIITFFLFRTSYNYCKPSLKFFDWKYSKDLFSIGMQFFVIQASVILVFSTSNLLIAQFLGPKEVTNYNIVYKYFSSMTMLFTIITTPFWSAYTDAYYKSDFSWIKKITKKLLIVWFILSIIIIAMIFLSNKFYRIWIGKEFHVPFNISVYMGIYTILYTGSSIFLYFINGVNKIRLQLVMSIILAVISFSTSIFFLKNTNLGLSGIIIAISIAPLINLLWSPIQYYKIINNKAMGIWSK